MRAITPVTAKGLKFGAEPRKLAILGGLIVVAIAALIYNSNDSGSSPASTSIARQTGGAPTLSAPLRQRLRKRAVQRNSDRNTLRMHEVTLEAQQGQIDPTLRLDLLQRLKTIATSGSTRSLFESGPAQAAELASSKPVKVMPGALPAGAAQAHAVAIAQAAMAQNAPITLKFYGFTAPAAGAGPRRGFFLDEDNVLVADEGDLLKGRYRIVSLQARSAEVEDTTTKSRQSLPIIPELQNAP